MLNLGNAFHGTISVYQNLWITQSTIQHTQLMQQEVELL